MMFTPGVSVGTMNIDMPPCASTSASVTAITIRNEDQRAFEENHFSPLITQWSPSRTARVLNRVGSAPACGSVIE